MQSIQFLGVNLGDVTPAPGTPTLATLADPPWYQTWWGIGLLGVGGFFAYKHFTKPKSKK